MAKTIAFESLEEEYASLLETYEFKPNWQPVLMRQAAKIRASQDRYEQVSAKTGVPWEFIAVVHMMEGGCNFGTHLHNGDPLTKKTRQVPKNRPTTGSPPFTWEESAIDALTLKGLQDVTEWTDERIAYELERYNGFGYRLHHPNVLTPYLWSGTSHYVAGKYVADGKWSNTHTSKQLGAIPLFYALRGTDLTKKEVVTSSAKLSFGQSIRRWMGSIGAGGLGLFSLDSAGLITGQLKEIKEIVQDNAMLILVVSGIGVWLLLKWFESKQYQDYKEGRYVPSKVDQ